MFLYHTLQNDLYATFYAPHFLYQQKLALTTKYTTLFQFVTQYIVALIKTFYNNRFNVIFFGRANIF